MDILRFHVLRNVALTSVLKMTETHQGRFWFCRFKERTHLSVTSVEAAGIPSSAWLKENSVLCIASVILQFSHQNRFNSWFLPSAVLTQPFLPSRRHFYTPECILSIYKGCGPLKQEVPLKAGSFCSSLLLLRLKREELCLLSFLTGVWEPGCFPFNSWVVGGALLLAFLLEVCGNRKNVSLYLTKPHCEGAAVMTGHRSSKPH